MFIAIQYLPDLLLCHLPFRILPMYREKTCCPATKGQGAWHPVSPANAKLLNLINKCSNFSIKRGQKHILKIPGPVY